MSATLQTIGIIGGTGAEGSGIAVRAAHAGYRVIIGTRDPAKGAAITNELNTLLKGKTLSWAENRAAVQSADIVILTVPYAAQQATAEGLRTALEGKILIDATVPLKPPKVANVQLPEGGSAVAALQETLGNSVKVVSAFQNVSAHKLRKLDSDVDCDVLVCSDDAEARRITLELIANMKMRGIDAGPLCNSAAAEALTSVLIAINKKYKIPGSGIRITGLS